MIPYKHEKRLEQLNEVFLEENCKLNLSAFRTSELSWVGNIMDSLAVLDTPLLQKNSKLNILDLGTGGGFPLLPLAICLSPEASAKGGCPNCKFTGIDATQKKVSAVENIAQTLELKNVDVVAGRAEELGRDEKYREQFDIVLSRAVAPINTLLEYCAPFTKVKGHIVLWKSLTIEQELKDSLIARAELSCHLIDKYEYELPEKFGKRQLLIFEKTFKTKPKYPRDVGIPKKNPIV
ncbi:16S rRNA (guanine(527)-N(7))-methyltransferase RsmG [Patescibacteria group bacterium]|nr:16S rRNA (guanine(527)-N(7))-methyltransferase RsmG [Patescibacteria group bacterium]